MTETKDDDNVPSEQDLLPRLDVCRIELWLRDAWRGAVVGCHRGPLSFPRYHSLLFNLSKLTKQTVKWRGEKSALVRTWLKLVSSENLQLYQVMTDTFSSSSLLSTSFSQSDMSCWRRCMASSLTAWSDSLGLNVTRIRLLWFKGESSGMTEIIASRYSFIYSSYSLVIFPSKLILNVTLPRSK